MPNSWHLVHLGSRAVGGAGLVITEATSVEARGRISPGDTGIYTDEQAAAWSPIAHFIREQGAVAGMQLAHAGRKASTPNPFPIDGAELENWEIVAPSAIPFDESYGTPRALEASEIGEIVQKFKVSAERAIAAGFQVLEIHGAHGYLLNEFLSPLTNKRTDEYGGSLTNRARFLKEVIEAVRQVAGEQIALFVRISAIDWMEGGFIIEDSVELAKIIKPLGVDLIDVSSGGLVPGAKIQVGPGYQVGFAERIRREAGIAVGAVGMITEPQQAQEIVDSGKADIVLLAREMLRDPYWPRRAAAELGVKIAPPAQYGRAWL